MGQPSLEETKRNENLIIDYNSKKFSQSELVVKYGISHSRIYQIINRDKKRRGLKN
jgi:Mor family transcriptional regulator